MKSGVSPTSLGECFQDSVELVDSTRTSEMLAHGVSMLVGRQEKIHARPLRWRLRPDSALIVKIL